MSRGHNPKGVEPREYGPLFAAAVEAEGESGERRERLILWSGLAMQALAASIVPDGGKGAAERTAEKAWDLAEAMERERERRGR